VPPTPAPTAAPTLPPIAPIPASNVSIGSVTVHKGGTALAGGNYSLATISQDGDANANPTSINPNSTSKPDKVVPHGLGEFVNYNHNTGR